MVAKIETKEKIDPVTLQIIGGALHTIAKEMAHVIERMSYSSLIRGHGGEPRVRS